MDEARAEHEAILAANQWISEHREKNRSLILSESAQAAYREGIIFGYMLAMRKYKPKMSRYAIFDPVLQQYFGGRGRVWTSRVEEALLLYTREDAEEQVQNIRGGREAHQILAVEI